VTNKHLQFCVGDKQATAQRKELRRWHILVIQLTRVKAAAGQRQLRGMLLSVPPRALFVDGCSWNLYLCSACFGALPIKADGA
jgi:hypothetical protein